MILVGHALSIEARSRLTQRLFQNHFGTLHVSLCAQYIRLLTLNDSSLMDGEGDVFLE